MNSIKPETIKKYIEKGFSVFPVMLTKNGDKYDKKPMVEWTDYQTRYATDQEIDVWCSMLDFNALGMATGKISGVTVIDLDDPNIDDFTSTVKTKTISGGFHLWYKYKAGVRNAVRVKDKLMDIRGDGGFVVIPPSKISENEKYSWIKHDFENMPDFPTIVQQKREFKKTMVELPTASSGNRNQTAIQVAGHMVAMTKKEAWETTAWSAFQQWNSTHVEPPIDMFELKRTFDSACQMKSLQTAKNEPISRIFTGDQITREYEAMVKKWGNGIPTGYNLLDNYFKFLPEQLYLISAPTHHGKTTVAMNLSARVASMGFNVIFCSLEQGIFIAPRVKSSVGSMPPTLSILTSDGLLSVKNLIEIVNQRPERTDLLVIDHLHFMNKEVKHGITNAIELMMIELQNSAKTMGIPILLISHLRKLNEKREPTLDDLKDSSALSQVPSVVIQLYSQKKEDGVNHADTGSFMIRKNRVTGKLGKLSYVIKETGEVEIINYINEEKIRL